MEMSEEMLTFLVPAIFVAVSVILGIFGLAYGKRRAAEERERAGQIGSALGLELVGEDNQFQTLVPEENPDREKAMALLGKIPLFSMLRGFATWRLGGTREGVRVEIFPDTRSSGKNTTTYTVARAWLRKPLDQELRLAHEGFFTKLGKSLFGLQDVELGEATFDAAVRVKAKDPLAAKLLLDRADAREAVLALIGTHHAAFVTREYAQWERVGTKLDEAELRGIIDLLVPVARTLGA